MHDLERRRRMSMWEMRRWNGSALPLLSPLPKLTMSPVRPSYPSSLWARFLDGHGIGSDGKGTTVDEGPSGSEQGGCTVRTPRRAAALVLATETVGAAFLMTGSLKCTFGERVA